MYIRPFCNNPPASSLPVISHSRSPPGFIHMANAPFLLVMKGS